MHLLLAWRRSRRHPASSIAIVALLGLGFAAVMAVSSATLPSIRGELSVNDPRSLFAAYETTPEGEHTGVSLQGLVDWRTATEQASSDAEATNGSAFAGLAAYMLRTFGVRGEKSQDLQVIRIGMVTGDFFEVLGAGLAQGRGLSREDVLGARRFIVLSETSRRQFFEGESEVLGKYLELNETEYTVIGVLSHDFDFPIQAGRSQTSGGGYVPGAFIPLSHADYGGRRQVRTLGAIARLQGDASRISAQAELSGIASRLSVEFPETNRRYGVDLVPIREAIYGPNRTAVLTTSGAVLLLVLIVAVNVSSLMAAGWTRRVSSLATRRALGGDRASLIKLVGAETALYGVISFAAAWWLAHRLLEILGWLFPLLGGFPPMRLSIDGTSVVFAFGVLAAMAVTFILLQARWLERQIQSNPFSAKASDFRHGKKVMLLAITVQATLSGFLFLSASVLTKSFLNVLGEERGFSTEHIVVFGIGLPDRYPEDETIIRFHQRFIEALSSIQGVDAVTFSGLSAPLGGMSRQSFELEERPLPAIERPRAIFSVITPDYFRTLDIPVHRGRPSGWRDNPESKRVLQVSESFVDRYLGGDWLGRRLRLAWFDDLTPAGTLWEIVGVVGDVRAAGLDRRPEPTIYLPASQVPANGGIYFLKTERVDAALFEAIRREKIRLDPAIQELNPYFMSERIQTSLSDRRFSLWLAAALSGLALLLSSIGIFGAIATRQSQQAHTFGVRLAVGDTVDGLKRRMLRDGLAVVSTGLGASVLVYLPASRLIATQLYGVRVLDIGSMILMAVAHLAACYVAGMLAARKLEGSALIKLLSQHG